MKNILFLNNDTLTKLEKINNYLINNIDVIDEVLLERMNNVLYPKFISDKETERRIKKINNLYFDLKLNI